MRRKIYFLIGVLPSVIAIFFFSQHPEWRNHVLARFYCARNNKQAGSSCYMKALEFVKSEKLPPSDLLISDFLSFATEEMLKKEPGLAEGLIFLAAIVSDKNIFSRLESYGDYLQKNNNSGELLRFSGLLKESLSENSLGFFLEARYLKSKHEIEQACKMYASALKRRPFFTEAALFVADCYTEGGRDGELINLLGPLELEYKQNFKLLSSLGQAYFRIGKFAEAARILELCVKLRPEAVVEMRLLGECGLRLGREDYADLLRQIFEMNKLDYPAALSWARFMAEREKYELLVSFFSRHAFSDAEFQKIYYQSLRHEQELEKLGKFLETTVLSENDYPEFPYFRGIYHESIGQSEQAKSFFYSCVNNDELAIDFKKDSFERLFKKLSEQDEPQEVLELLQQWIRFEPANSELYLKMAAVYEKKSDYESALREMLNALNYFPGDIKVLEKTSELLLRQNVPFRIISLLSDFPRLYHHGNLVLLFCQALVQTGAGERARLVLEQYMSASGIEPILSGESPENEEQARFMMVYDMVVNENSSKKAIFELSSVGKEREFLERLQSFGRAGQEKNSLPPPIGLSQPLQLQARLKRGFGFKGKTRVYLPKGAKVEFMELPLYLQEFLGVGEGEYCLARYRGKLHRINRRYLDIIKPQRGEAMGEAYIAEIDGDYEAIAEIEELFDKEAEFTIVEAGSFASDRMIRFDDENYVKFFSIPKSSYTLRRQDKVYFHFPREPLQILDGYDFLREDDFADLLLVPSEQLLVLFGPDDGGVALFNATNRNSLFRVRITDKYTGLHRGIYDRLFYRGYLILDVNNDGVLDYISLWQSKEKQRYGFLHILSSADGGKYRDFTLLTTLDFLDDYEYASRISILHFLRDLNEDGVLEFVVREAVSVRPDSSLAVSYSSIYGFEKGVLRNVSRYFPVYMREELRKLDEKKALMQVSTEMIDAQLAEWNYNYNTAVERIGKTMRGEI